MAPAFRQLGIELHVAFLRDRWDVADRLVAGGAHLHPVGVAGGRVRQLLRLVRLIRRLDPDVVHTTLWEADVIGRTAAAVTRRPSVTTFTGSTHANQTRRALPISKVRAAHFLDALTARWASHFQAVSVQVADDMSRILRIDRSRITVIPRARQRDVLGEPSVERRTRVRRRLGISNTRPVVLAVARHEYVKGVDVLVDSAAALNRALPDVLVLVAGRDGRDSSSLRRTCAEKSLDDVVWMLGTRSDVADLIVAADVVAVPSRSEGLPGVVLEAMALERPVVASNLPAVTEAIGVHACALVPVGDSDALAAALLDCLRRRHDTERVTAARARFDLHFAPVPIVQRLLAMYESVIKE